MPTDLSITWALAICAEITLLSQFLRAWLRRCYPGFMYYLLFDISVSVVLYGYAWMDPAVYTSLWITVTDLLIFGRIVLFFEAIMGLGGLWLPEVLGLLTLSVGTLVGVVTWFLRPPNLWLWSLLQPTELLVAASSLTFGTVLILLCSDYAFRSRLSTIPVRHAIILGVYFLLNSAGYYAAAHAAPVSRNLLTGVGFCYAVWTVVFWRGAQAGSESRI
jgi:hypothetical protein